MLLYMYMIILRLLNFKVFCSESKEKISKKSRDKIRNNNNTFKKQDLTYEQNLQAKAYISRLIENILSKKYIKLCLLYRPTGEKYNLDFSVNNNSIFLKSSGFISLLTFSANEYEYHLKIIQNSIKGNTHPLISNIVKNLNLSKEEKFQLIFSQVNKYCEIIEFNEETNTIVFFILDNKEVVFLNFLDDEIKIIRFFADNNSEYLLDMVF